ncbi:MAG: 2'-deoxycytidine 5'-triphosphate deaminase [bacterium]|nr:2'-deoxycytidine 5'-triphosphate deaminase [bacterium]
MGSSSNDSRGHLLVDRDLAAAIGKTLLTVPGAEPVSPGQVQPASVDLRLGPLAHRIRASFLPGGTSIEERIDDLSTSALSLEGEGGVLERGLIYLVPLEETLALPPGVRARFNPRSSAGRCDVFTRVLIPGHPRFDETPPGYHGPLWVEVSPLSFPVRVRRGDRLCQARLQTGRAGLATDELRELYRRTPLAFDGDRPLGEDEVRFDEDGGLELRVGLANRDPAGWRAAPNTSVVDFGRERAHAADDFFEPVHAPRGRCILAPNHFYLFASKERLRVPPDVAAEMLPVDVGIGELRNNYAGFFDSGFGWQEGVDGGTPAVLEVRARDVPFLVEDGQVFFRLRFFRTAGRPDSLYGEGRSGGSYRDQDLTLARTFR